MARLFILLFGASSVLQTLAITPPWCYNHGRRACIKQAQKTSMITITTPHAQVVLAGRDDSPKTTLSPVSVLVTMTSTTICIPQIATVGDYTVENASQVTPTAEAGPTNYIVDSGWIYDHIIEAHGMMKLVDSMASIEEWCSNRCTARIPDADMPECKSFFSSRGML